MKKHDDPKPTPKEESAEKPAAPAGIPQEGDRAARFVGGPSDVQVKGGTVTL